MARIHLKINVLRQFGTDDIGISPRAVARVNRKAANLYLKTVHDFVPPNVARDNGLLLTSFKRVRSRRSRLTARGKGSLFGRFWFGKNDVLARYKKGRYKVTSDGAGKGNMFKKGAFVMKFKNNSQKGLFTRGKDGKLEPVKVQLNNVSARIKEGSAQAEASVIKQLHTLVDAELNKKVR